MLDRWFHDAIAFESRDAGRADPAADQYSQDDRPADGALLYDTLYDIFLISQLHRCMYRDWSSAAGVVVSGWPSAPEGSMLGTPCLPHCAHLLLSEAHERT